MWLIAVGCPPALPSLLRKHLPRVVQLVKQPLTFMLCSQLVPAAGPVPTICRVEAAFLVDIGVAVRWLDHHGRAVTAKLDVSENARSRQFLLEQGPLQVEVYTF